MRESNHPNDDDYLLITWRGIRIRFVSNQVPLILVLLRLLRNHRSMQYFTAQQTVNKSLWWWFFFHPSIHSLWLLNHSIRNDHHFDYSVSRILRNTFAFIIRTIQWFFHQHFREGRKESCMKKMGSEWMADKWWKEENSIWNIVIQSSSEIGRLTLPVYFNMTIFRQSICKIVFHSSSSKESCLESVSFQVL